MAKRHGAKMTYQPFFTQQPENPSRWLVTCDHATNHIPDFVNGGSLGLPDADMQRHIAYDPGAAGVAQALAKRLHGVYLGSNFSRLVIDPNRGEDDPTLVMRLYDGTIIPANRHLDTNGIELRLNQCYRPYHTALANFAEQRDDTIIVSVHSFTRQFRARPQRPWHIGVLFASDERLSRPMIARLRSENGLCIGENEPYTGALVGDALDRHAVQSGRPHTLLEFRNDLIKTRQQQNDWAARVAPILVAAARDAGL